MQYLDSSHNWVTYDTKYGKTFNDYTSLVVSNNNGNLTSTICGCGSINGANSSQAGNGGFWAFAVDPRTSRFGLLWNGTYPLNGDYRGLNSPFMGYVGYSTIKPLPCYTGGGTFLNQSGGWIDKGNWISLTVRPDRVGGWYAMAGWPFSGGAGFGGGTPWTGGKIGDTGNTSGWMAYVGSNYKSNSGGTGGIYPGLQPGVLAQNNADAQQYYRRYYSDGGGGNGEKNTPQYFADPDGIVRRGMAGFIPPDPTYPAVTTVGLPMAQTYSYSPGSAPSVSTDPAITTYNPSTSVPQATSQAQSRPYMLHRPFRSVGELGYVFSDTPWRNLDFSTAESGGAALLDGFCINETSDPNALVAGKVNLNTRQTPVLKAILTEAYLDLILMSGTFALSRLDAADTANRVAQALVARTTGTSSNLGPLQNVSELVGKFVSKTPIRDLGSSYLNGGDMGTLDSAKGFFDGKLSYSGFSDGGWDTTNRTPKTFSPASDVYSAYMASGAFANSPNKNGTQETVSYIQRLREAPIRALSNAGQTRVWNLMIDVVAQTGRYPKSANNINKFIVEGEQRYWVHVAIDRFTGVIIDKQVEVVKE